MRIVMLCKGEHACVTEAGWVSGGLCCDLSSLAELAMGWTLEAVGFLCFNTRGRMILQQACICDCSRGVALQTSCKAGTVSACSHN
jgi:hypothetical protein